MKKEAVINNNWYQVKKLAKKRFWLTLRYIFLASLEKHSGRTEEDKIHSKNFCQHIAALFQPSHIYN